MTISPRRKLNVPSLMRDKSAQCMHTQWTSLCNVIHLQDAVQKGVYAARVEGRHGEIYVRVGGASHDEVGNHAGLVLPKSQLATGFVTNRA